MIFIFLIWLLSSVVFAVFDIKKSILALISYRLLVPFYSFSAAGLLVEYNYVLLFVFLMFVIKMIREKDRIDYTFIVPFLIFITVIAFCIPFGTDLAISDQFTFLRNFVIANLLLPIMIWQLYNNAPDIKKLINVLLFCLIMMGAYGIYCFITGANPYVKSLSTIFNTVDNNEIFSKKIRSGLVGKIQSTTYHPFFWSALLTIFLMGINSLMPKRTFGFYFIFMLLFLNLLLCNVRTGIVSFAVGMIVLLVFPTAKGRGILFGSILFVVALGGLDLSFFGKYKPYVESIVYFYNPNKSIAGGSTYNMRETQFKGTMDIWDHSSFTFGNGFGWCSNYYQLHGDHPQLYGFEGMIYVIIIDQGLMGIITWAFLFFSLIRINYVLNFKKYKYDFWVISGMVASYIVFCIATGIFTLNFFLIFFVLINRKLIIERSKIFITNVGTTKATS